MSRKSPDRRLGCNTSVNNPTKFFGGCSQQSQISMSAIKIKYNTTLMKDYASGSNYNASGIYPYGFANQDGVSTGQGTAGSAPCCSPYSQDPLDCEGYVCGATGGAGNGSLPCGLPAVTDILTCENQLSFSAGLGPYHNCYTESNDTKSYSHCTQVGFKNAYAYKTHFGRLGYTSRMGSNLETDLFDWSGCGCKYHSYDPIPDTTRYLLFTANSSFSRTFAVACVNTYDGGTYDCCGEPNPCVKANCCEELTAECWTGTDAGNASATSNVDRYSGNVTNTCSSGSSTYGTNSPACECSGEFATNCYEETCNCGTPTDRLPEDIANTLYYNAQEAFNDLSKVAGDVSDIGSLWSLLVCSAPDCRCTITAAGAGASATYEMRRTCYTDACDFVGTDEWITIKTMAIDYSAGTSTDTVYSEYRYGYVGCPADSTGCVPYSAFYTRAYSFSATSATYSEEWNSANSESVWSTGTKTVTGTLSGAYTTEDVYQDCVNLLSHLPLDRDDLLPWRTDTNITTGPLCHYDESGAGAPNLACESSTGSLPTGYIYGIPGPSGIDHVFNPGMLEYCVCTDPGGWCGDNTCQYVKHIGQWNDVIGGGSPTCWTNAYEASNIPQYAFVSNYTFQVVPCSCNWDAETSTYVSTRLWMGKWAEIIIPNRRSFNFARPCGADRFLVSESTNRCVTAVTDQTLTYDWTGGESNLISGQKVWVCGVAGIEDGCYKADNIGGYQITLTECVVSASNLPDVPIDNCGTGVFSILKYQNAPSVCGRVDITSINNTTPLTCSLKEPTYLVNNDLVRVVGSIGAPINTYWRVIVIDPSTIALSGSVSGSWSYTPESAAIYDPWAADWKWNDTDPKGDYTAYEWEYDYRTAAEYNRLVAKAEWNAGLTYAGDLTQDVGCNVSCDQQCPAPPQISQPHPTSCYGPELDRVSCTTHCLKPNACSPLVAFWSPNGETFGSGTFSGSARNHGFGHPVMDEQYGTMWQGAFKQYMSDPIWTAPPCPCVYDAETFTYGCDCSIQEDNGTCLGDSAIPCINYVAKRPMFEARCSVPEGAPPLPNKISLGCQPVDQGPCDYNGSTVLCYGPYVYGNGFLDQKNGCVAHTEPWATPWADYLNQFNCICAEGRFATEYGQNGISCDSNLFVPAP